jgi:hypothetical protein
MYKSGVYSYSRIPPDNLPDDDKGYHSIRIIGLDMPSFLNQQMLLKVV